jgi:hypothetical protein
MPAELVCDALKMAIAHRGTRPGLIIHSDRGSQYASNLHRKLLKKHGMEASMNRKGNCWGRVDMWRGVFRSGISVSVPFVERCLNSQNHGFVSTCRSSNRTYRFPVSGFLQRYQTFAFERTRPDDGSSKRTRPRVSYTGTSQDIGDIQFPVGPSGVASSS